MREGKTVAKATRKRRNSPLGQLTPAGELLEMIAMRHIPQALHVVAVLGIADLSRTYVSTKSRRAIRCRNQRTRRGAYWL